MSPQVGWAGENYQMDSVWNEQFVEEERDSLAVELPADVADFPGFEVVRTGSAHDAPAASRPTGQIDDASLSSDPLDAYFRNLDHGALMSRDEELVLAKRIDEAQTALLTGLCRIPLIVQRVAAWAGEVREGGLRLTYLIDLLPSDEGENGEDDPLYNGNTGDLGAEAEGLTPQLELAVSLGAEIGPLARKRIAALARGDELTQCESKRLEDSLSRAAANIVDMHLQPDRISELLVEVDSETRTLRRTELELLRLAEGCGIAGEEMIDRVFGRELDPEWNVNTVSQYGRGWDVFTEENASALAEFRAESEAVTLRVGLSLNELRVALKDIHRARRELTRLREQMVHAHLRLVIAIAKKYRGRSSLDF